MRETPSRPELKAIRRPSGEAEGSASCPEKVRGLILTGSMNSGDVSRRTRPKPASPPMIPPTANQASAARRRPALLRGAGTAVPARALDASKAFWRPKARSEEHTSELQSQSNLVCRLLLEKK